MDIPIRFFTFDPGESSKGITSEDIVTHTGSIILLSDREATIRSNADISGCRFLKGHIILDDETIELVGMVDPINEKKNIYNLLFAGMNDRVRNQILIIFSAPIANSVSPLCSERPAYLPPLPINLLQVV